MGWMLSVHALIIVLFSIQSLAGKLYVCHLYKCSVLNIIYLEIHGSRKSNDLYR